VKRVIAILGVPRLVEAITAFLSWLAVTIQARIPLGYGDTDLAELSRNRENAHWPTLPQRIVR